MTINDLRDIAIKHGIVILDYETVETLRSRKSQFIEHVDLDAVPDEKLIRVMSQFETMHRSDLPLLTDYDDANKLIDQGFRDALIDQGLIPADDTEAEDAQ